MSDAIAKKAPKKSWFKGLKSEFKKVMWADRKTITKQTIAVMSISIVLGLIITIIDTILQYGIDFIIAL